MRMEELMRMEEPEEELQELTITVILIIMRSARAVLPVSSSQKMAIPLRSVATGLGTTQAAEIMI